MHVWKAPAAGMSARQAAGRFEIGVSTSSRWIARAVEREPTLRLQGWKRPSVLDAQGAFVVEMIGDRKVVMRDEMVECLSAEPQVSISRSVLGAWLRGRGWTFKKVCIRIGAGPTGRPDAPTGLGLMSSSIVIC